MNDVRPGLAFRISLIVGMVFWSSISSPIQTMFLAEAWAASPSPVLETIFPLGCRAGDTVEVTISGTQLDKVRTLLSNIAEFRCETIDSRRYKISIAAEVAPGSYDLWAVGDEGISNARSFAVGNRAEIVESEPNSLADSRLVVPLSSTVNGRIEPAGDQDFFRFEARKGQRVVIECWSERVDSRLRAALEIFDSSGNRLAANRGFFGIEPLVDFHAPADGTYDVKVQDLISSGGAEYGYRLDIDTGPRVAFTVPNTVQRGKLTSVTFYGWNLGSIGGLNPVSGFERVELEVAAAEPRLNSPLPLRLAPSQAGLDVFAFQLPQGNTPTMLGVSDAPIVLDTANSRGAISALEISVPCEICGQLAESDESDWYALDVSRGEVLYFEAFGQRIGSPVDLRIGLYEASGKTELANFNDETQNLGGTIVPTSHLDPLGRWVAPADGKYLISVRNLAGGAEADPRRVYCVSVRREEPDFQLIVIPQSGTSGGLRMRTGSREAVDVIALRRRGMNSPICLTANNLPDGVECPETWIGPNEQRSTLVFSASDIAKPGMSYLDLDGHAQGVGIRHARFSTEVRKAVPNGWSRLISRMPITVEGGQTPMRATANAHETLEHHLYGHLDVRHSPGSIIDVAVTVERIEPYNRAPVRLIASGLPASIRNQTATIPAGERRGYVSFYIPPTMPLGKFSFTIRAESSIMTDTKQAEIAVAYSNAVTIDVQPAAFRVEVDPFAIRTAKRGETIQVGYTGHRLNGFIGKIHTELAVPGVITNVSGLRARGETFVGQTDKGSLQIIVNDDAGLGPQPFLRLFSVGVIEDEPVFFGSDFWELEIVE